MVCNKITIISGTLFNLKEEILNNHVVAHFSY